MTRWIRFAHKGESKFGILDNDQITVYEGDMFDHPRSTELTLSLSAITTLTSTVPSKFIGLWNNLTAQSKKF